MNDFYYYQNTACSNLINLINDQVTYSVLIKILNNTCQKIFTDNKCVVICHSNPPYPVWIYTNDLSEKSVNKIANCIKANFAFENGFNIILSDELLKKLQTYDEYFANVKLKMPLLSYRLDQINTINYPVLGKVLPAKENDFEFLTDLYADMVFEMEGFKFDKATCAKKIKQHFQDKDLFTFINEKGEIVATTACIKENKFAKISMVYTLPDKRRKGYAINLVHALCKDAVKKGLTPILYTDGSYEASNDCYKKIGFYKVGTLLNVQK